MNRPVRIVVEEDVFTRVLGVILDPSTSAERLAAFTDFFAHDVPDFEGWLRRLRSCCTVAWPADVRFVETSDQLRDALPEADALLVETLAIGEAELALAPRLKAVQKYGCITRNIDTTACERRGVRVLTVRRRANIACAEQAFMMMLALAKRLPELDKRTTDARLRAGGFSPRAFDRRHTPGGNWGRVPGIAMLDGSVLGIIGMGEIGREIALRARPFGMRTVYSQRTRLDDATERSLGIEYLPLDDLLAASDWLVPQLPATDATHELLDAARFARIKPGARLINVARAQVMQRSALIAALRDGRLGGLGLDTLWHEPGDDDDELLRMPNVVMTPHMAGSPRTNATADFETMVADLDRALAGTG